MSSSSGDFESWIISEQNFSNAIYGSKNREQNDVIKIVRHI